MLLFLFLGIVLFSAMYSNVKPERLNIELLSIAEQTIRSPITVIDKESTEKKKDEAEAQVKDVYVVKKEIAENRVDLISSIFNFAANAEKEILNEREGGNEKEASRPISMKEKLDFLKSKLTNDVVENISETTFQTLVTASKQELEITKDLTITAINNVMKESISADEVENGKKRVEEELKYTMASGSLRNAAIELGRYAIMQNEFFDAEKTQELREQARESVEPVKILQGQIIVEENQLINDEIYRQLELVGLLDNENSPFPFIGLSLMIIIFLSVIYYYFYELNVKNKMKQNYILIFSIIFVLSIILLKGISFIQSLDIPEVGYVFPAAMGALLLKILINERLALLWTIITAICGSIIFNEGTTGSLNYSVGIYILISGVAAILYLNEKNQRTNIWKAGLVISLVNLSAIMAILFLQNAHLSVIEYASYAGAAFTSGIISAVLTIGLLPFIEAGFGLLSSMKLIELSNPNHPLLRKILMEAPGTYHHSLMVANLAESACEAIGANGLLARVGCYYHDIGKTNRPKFFIENQMNMENPHQRLSPEISKNIIISHVIDGVEILRKHRMPKEIIDIAQQHHGTTLLKYFYHKAKEEGMNVSEDEYRYPGPKPQTKEAAIVGIADSVEAAVRSLSHPTPQKIEEMVHNIITSRLYDGQLIECDLTLKELAIVENTLCESLKGMFHSRIEYPETGKEKKIKS